MMDEPVRYTFVTLYGNGLKFRGKFFASDEGGDDDAELLRLRIRISINRIRNGMIGSMTTIMFSCHYTMYIHVSYFIHF